MKTCYVRCWNSRVLATADIDGTVRVYDSVAGYYTSCHSLTPGQIAYVLRMTR